METICASERLQVYFGVKCIQGSLMFPPVQPQAVLIAWLHYRGVYGLGTLSYEQLIDATIQDMKDYGDTPQFKYFMNWRPHEVNEEFIVMWLSHHGVGSELPRSKDWYESKAERLLKVQPQQKPPLSIDQLVQHHSRLVSVNENLDCIEAFLYKVPVKTLTKLSTVHSKRTAREWDTKRLTAVLLGASALAVPMVSNWATGQVELVGLKDFHTEFARNLGGQLYTMGLPLIVTETSKRLSPTAIPKEVRQAILDDVASGAYIPRRTILKLIGGSKDSLTYQLLATVLLPSLEASLFKKGKSKESSKSES